MKVRRAHAYALLVSTLYLPMAYGMGLRSFVALPVDKGGTVLRAVVEHNADTDTSVSEVSAAHGISHLQTLLFGLPYRLSSGTGDRLGDVSALYRHIVLQSDQDAGTDRLGLLGGMTIPTNSGRDEAIQLGAVFTHYRGRDEIDFDVLYQQGLGHRDNTSRYDLSWQHRVSPPAYPEWGIPREWWIVTELGGRWREGKSTVHQLTVGLQWVANRWVLEGGVIQDLDDSNHTRFLFSVRFHW
jgi:hypothetical protein